MIYNILIGVIVYITILIVLLATDRTEGHKFLNNFLCLSVLSVYLAIVALVVWLLWKLISCLVGNSI